MCRLLRGFMALNEGASLLERKLNSNVLWFILILERISFDIPLVRGFTGVKQGDASGNKPMGSCRTMI